MGKLVFSFGIFIKIYNDSVEKNNLDKVAAAEIVQVTIDNKAYCWINQAHFDFSYSSYLNGKTEKEIHRHAHPDLARLQRHDG